MADLGLDSLTMTEITFFTEELFGVVFEIEELMPIVTIGDLKAFMRTKIRATAGSDHGQSN
jgi:acyl carrier protein